MHERPAETLIAVDVGNTSAHLGRFESGDPAGLPTPRAVAQIRLSDADYSAAAAILPAPPIAWWIASVNRPGLTRLLQWIDQQRPGDAVHVLTGQQMPVGIDVEQPEQVGIDRLAGVTAANLLRDPARPAIVVDAGTAITIDVLSRNGVFLGGAILPGLAVSARSLFEWTDLLPLVEVDSENPPQAIGRNTETNIHSGLFWGAVGAVRELIVRTAAELGETPDLFFAGGDASRLGPWVAPEARCYPHLVLSGIAIAARRLS